PRLHFDECHGGPPHLPCAPGPKVRHIAALSEALDRLGESQNRANLIAQEQDRDCDQYERGTAHPQQEDYRIRLIGGAAVRERAHDRVLELNPDLDEVRAANSIDPERFADLLAKLLRKRLIERGEEGLRPNRGQLGDGQEIYDETEPVLRDAAQFSVVPILRKTPAHVDNG